MAPPKIIDLDAELGLSSVNSAPTRKVRMFGKEWRVLCDVNSFTLTDVASGEAGALSHLIRGVIHKDEREDFAKALNEQAGLTPEVLGKLVSKLIEVASERPTGSPSPSQRTAKSRTSALKSVDG